MLWKFAIFVLIFFPSAHGDGDGLPDLPAKADSKADAMAGAKADDGLPGVWVGDMFYRALSNFTVQTDLGSVACRKQTEMYVWHLRNNSYWAVKSEYARSMRGFPIDEIERDIVIL